MKVLELIDKLIEAHNTYGNYDIEINVIDGDRVDLQGLCIDTAERTMLIDVDIEQDMRYKPIFNVYEYEE